LRIIYYFIRIWIINSRFECNPDTGENEEWWSWRITSEDIEKGNEILRKVITYLEETYVTDKMKDKMDE